MKSAGIIFSIVSLIIIFSCGSETPVQEKPVAKKTNTVVIADFQKLFSGSIDGKYAFDMDLKLKGKELSGSYKYRTQSNSLSLKGSVDSSGKLSLNEFNGKGAITGIFSGEFSDSGLKGEWKVPDGSRTLSFEAVTKTKKQILEKTIGDYTLNAIGGVNCSNVLIDIDKKNGKWISSYSEIIMGMREGESSAVSKKDIRLFNSIHINIDSALTVRVYVKEKLLLESRFIENGMDYRVKEKSKKELDFYIKD
ncbi:MAG: hypothetical protein IAF38_16830, partial [Bacteroidia bacterium]|nr:hypothetical protein [Bacteroidia bacterium]